MICIIALIVLAILSIFSAKYRPHAKEALNCVARRLTLRPCTVRFDQNVKAKITSKLLQKSPGLARFTHKHFEAISWVFTVVLFLSLAYSAYGIGNLIIYGTCDPVTNQCIFDPQEPNKVVCPFEDLEPKTGIPTIGNFLKIENSKIEGKPLVYFFGVTTCPHCTWERPVFVDATSKFGTWKNLREGDLSDASFESDYITVKATEIDKESNSDIVVFQHYSPEGKIPLIIFGGKYYRAGSGENLDVEQETNILTVFLCKITDSPISKCNEPEIKSLIEQI